VLFTCNICVVLSTGVASVSVSMTVSMAVYVVLSTIVTPVQKTMITTHNIYVLLSTGAARVYIVIWGVFD